MKPCQITITKTLIGIILPSTSVIGTLQSIYPEVQVRSISNCKLPMTEFEDSMIRDIHWFITVLCGRNYACKRFRFRYCIFESMRLVLLCVAAASWLDNEKFKYAYAIKGPQKHLCSQGRVWAMAKGPSLVLTWNHDVAGARPWCRWAASLLPSRSRKLAIMKQWFELAVELQSSQFSSQWWQQLVKYKLPWMYHLANKIIIGIHQGSD